MDGQQTATDFLQQPIFCKFSMEKMYFRRQLPQRIKDAQQKAKLLEDENAPVIIIFFLAMRA